LLAAVIPPQRTTTRHVDVAAGVVRRHLELLSRSDGSKSALTDRLFSEQAG
jgi:hypothetical protein